MNDVQMCKLETMKIFIIGSYFEDSEKKMQENIDKANRVGIKVLKKGHLPLVPQSMFAFWEKQVDAKLIMKACFDCIEECDAVLVLNLGREGGGTYQAHEAAREAGKKIFYSLDKIPLSGD